MKFSLLSLKNDELMKYGKLIRKIFDQQSNNNNAQIAIAVVAGLAAGAVLSILFAPDSGANTRGKIVDGAKGLGNGIKDKYTSLKDRITGNQDMDYFEEPSEIPHFTHERPKKRKSDIRDLVHESHVGGEGEQAF